MNTLRQMGIGLVPASMDSVTKVTRSFIEQQIDLYEVMMKQAPAAAFLRQQALLIDMTLSAMKAQRQLRKKSGR